MTPSDNVVQLSTEPEISAGEPSQFTLRVVIPDGRDITATVAYYPDRAGPKLNYLLDTTMDTLLRQRARWEVSQLEEKIYDGKKLLAEAEEAVSRVGTEASAKIEDLKAENLRQAKGYEKKYNELKEETREGHAFEPTSPGNRKYLDQFTRRQAEIQTEIEKLEKAAEAETKNFQASRQKQIEDLAEFERRLDVRKKIVG